MAENTELLIRNATNEDCEGVHNLMKVLAGHHGCEDKFTLELEDFQKYGFQANSFLRGIVVEATEATGIKRMVGCCVYLFTFDALRGRGIDFAGSVVIPEYWGHSVGKLLSQAAFMVALKNDCRVFTYLEHADNSSLKSTTQYLAMRNVGGVNGWQNMARVVSPADLRRLAGHVHTMPFKAHL